jgi:tagatose-1,6-bisphosphate aldolase
MKKDDKIGDRILEFFPKEKKVREMSKEILEAIVPLFKGESFEYIDGALNEARQSLREECLVSLRHSAKRRKI